MPRLDVPHNLTQHFNTRTGALELPQYIRKGDRVNFAHLLEGRRALSAADEQQCKAVNLIRSERGKVRIECLWWFAEDIDLLLECLEDRSCVVLGIAFGRRRRRGDWESDETIGVNSVPLAEIQHFLCVIPTVHTQRFTDRVLQPSAAGIKFEVEYISIVLQRSESFVDRTGDQESPIGNLRPQTGILGIWLRAEF